MPIVSREELEQLLLSLVLDLYDEEDISEINLIYSEYQKKNYIFPLSKTELYFKTFIITYCQLHCAQIIKKIISKEIQETFIANFQKDNIIPNKDLNNISNNEVNGSNCSFLNVNNENTNLIQPVNQISKKKKIIEWIKKRKYFIITLSIIGILLIFCLIFTI